MAKKLDAEHGIVCRLPGERFGYFGWPTVARMDDGTLAVVSSGLRTQHVCPWGKGVLNISTDEGRTWSPPRVIHDTPLDDRDGGIASLGGQKLLTTWFTSDTRTYADGCLKTHGEEELKRWRATTDKWTEAGMRQWLGSWVALSDDGGTTWSAPLRAPVNTPHGPIRLSGGDLFYLGKRCTQDFSELLHGPILAARSSDGGRSWTQIGKVPLYPGTQGAHYHEPHAVEVPSGKLVGLIRLDECAPLGRTGLIGFSMMQTESADGGRTWSAPRPLGFHGSPPHLLRHSSGVLILTYGYRLPPFGQRVAFSRDAGATWEHDWLLRDDGPDLDLGYPSTVEMPDSSLFTVYYQKVKGDEKCSLMWSRWQLPAA